MCEVCIEASFPPHSLTHTEAQRQYAGWLAGWLAATSARGERYVRLINTT